VVAGIDNWILNYKFRLDRHSINVCTEEKAFATLRLWVNGQNLQKLSLKEFNYCCPYLVFCNTNTLSHKEMFVRVGRLKAIERKQIVVFFQTYDAWLLRSWNGFRDSTLVACDLVPNIYLHMIYIHTHVRFYGQCFDETYLYFLKTTDHYLGMLEIDWGKRKRDFFSLA
jgi:hypothetical protein